MTYKETTPMKPCARCNEAPRAVSKSNKRYAYCRECMNQYFRDKYHNKSETTHSKTPGRNPDGSIAACKKCGINEREVDSKTDKVYSYCVECRKKKQIQYYVNHKSEYNERSTKWKQENSERFVLWRRQYSRQERLKKGQKPHKFLGLPKPWPCADCEVNERLKNNSYCEECHLRRQREWYEQRQLAQGKTYKPYPAKGNRYNK